VEALIQASPEDWPKRFIKQGLKVGAVKFVFVNLAVINYYCFALIILLLILNQVGEVKEFLIVPN